MIQILKDHPILTGFGDHPYENMNATCGYYPLLLYMFAKCLGSQHILEIGTDTGTSAFWLASIAKENGGKYYGIDIDEKMCQRTSQTLIENDLPHKIICADTKTITDLRDFEIDRIDLAFVDGEHTTRAVEHEIELIYPLLTWQGWGFIFIHDIVDMGNAEIWWKLQKDPRFEKMGMCPNYGLGILRKIEGIDYEDIARRFPCQNP